MADISLAGLQALRRSCTVPSQRFPHNKGFHLSQHPDQLQETSNLLDKHVTSVMSGKPSGVQADLVDPIRAVLETEEVSAPPRRSERGSAAHPVCSCKVRPSKIQRELQRVRDARWACGWISLLP